jgi:hypothetical protein
VKPFVLCAAAVLALGWSAPAQCGDSRASEPGRALRAAARDTTPPTAADSARMRARELTDQLQQRCASDSAAARILARLAADSARVADSLRADSIRLADSTRAADSVRAVAASASDSVASHPSHPARHAAKRRRPAPPPADPPAWTPVVARRAVKQAPLPGSIFPGCRVVAYYGNPLSKRMGILGELPPDTMLERLARQAAAYARADSAHPVLPTLELIATVAQAGPGRDGMYRLRMSDTLIAKVIGWAARRNYLVLLDIQVGRSSVPREIAPLVKYLQLPNVHLALDPEFAMRPGKVPGRVIGTLDAADVNAAVDTLARLVSTYQLPPKMLVVHRFTRPMLTNHEAIRLDPRVQVVIDMDGFGPPHLKHDSYRRYVHERPVQFAGFKLFYKNDKPILTPEQVLKLTPVPLFIMYQ